MSQAVAQRHLVDHLRALGEFGRLAARAEAKARKLAELGDQAPSLQGTGMTEQALWRWYFEERLGTKVPDNREAFAASAGFSGADDMRAAVLRELFYVRNASR